MKVAQIPGRRDSGDPHLMVLKKGEEVMHERPGINIAPTKFKSYHADCRFEKHALTAFEHIQLVAFYIDFQQVNIFNSLAAAIVVDTQDLDLLRETHVNAKVVQLSFR